MPVPDFAIVSVPEERLDELEPLWRTARLYERRGAVPFLTKFIQRVGGAADDG